MERRALWILLAIVDGFGALGVDWNALVAQVQADGLCGAAALCRTAHPAPPDSRPQVPWNVDSVLEPNRMDDSQFLSTPCHCDADCLRHGDCCADAAGFWASDGGATVADAGWRCLPLHLNHQDPHLNSAQHAMYMLAACPRNATADASLLCRPGSADDAESGDHLRDVPVRSLATGVTYANVYCARCHGDADRLQSWDASVQCSEFGLSEEQVMQVIRPEFYEPGRRQWTYSDVTCSLVVDQFQDINKYLNVSGGRRCRPSIDRCPSETSTSDVGRMGCDAGYALPVAGNEGGRLVVFHNAHCAACHTGNATAAEPSQLVCHNVTLKPGKQGRKRLGGASLTLLFDFMPAGRGRCRGDEIWDPVVGRCHVLSCPRGHQISAGVCEAKNTSDYESRSDWNSTLEQEEQESDFQSSPTQDVVSTVCLTISVVSLYLHWIIDLLTVPIKSRNLPSKNLLSLSAALLLGQLLFLTAVKTFAVAADGAGSSVVCRLVAALSHWSYLAAFFWMNVMGYDISRAFSGNGGIVHRSSGRQGQRTFWRYSAYAWGAPALIVAAGLATDALRPASWPAPAYAAPGRVCWFGRRRGLAVFFVGPVAVLLAANALLFGRSVRSISQQRKYGRLASQSKNHNKKTADQKIHEARFVCYLKLALIMGLGWMFGFVAALAGVPFLWYPFLVLNGLQGLYILLAFDAKRSTASLLWQRLRCGGAGGAGRPTSVGETTSSTYVSALVRNSTLLLPPLDA